METIINSLMEKYFAVLFKNFKKENLKVNLFEGLSSGQSNLTLNDLDFTESVIQELLYIPPQLEVQIARVNSLRIMVPWSRLKNEPIVFTIDKINVEIAEPKEVRCVPRVWSQFQEKNRKGKPEEKRDRRDILSTLKVVVKEVHIGIKTMNGSALAIDIFDVVMQTTNGEWKVVDLEKAHVVDKEKKRELQFKEITARSLTIQLEQGELRQTILRDLPLRLQLVTTYSTDDKVENDLLSVAIDSFLEEVNFSWNQTSWKMMLTLIHGVVACLKRRAPPSPEKKTTADGPESISIGLNIGAWSLELKQDLADQGFSFFGYGLRFLLIPERHVILPPKTEAIESSLSISVQSFTFRELVAGKDKDPRYQKLITQAPLPPSATGNENILVFRVSSRRSEKEALSSLSALQLEFVLNGIQIVFDSEIWNNLKCFLELRPTITEAEAASPSPTPTPPPSPSPVLAAGGAVADAKLDFKTLAKNSIVIVEARNTVLIIPNDKRVPKFADKSLHLTIGKVGLSNRPDWKLIPSMAEVAKTLPFTPEALHFTTQEHADALKFQMEVSNVSVDLVDLKDKTERVLSPTSVRLQSRYAKVAVPGSHPVYQIELVLSWGQMDMRLTRAQYRFFNDLVFKYIDQFKAVLVSDAAAPAEPKPAEEGKPIDVAQLKSQASDLLHQVADKPTNEDAAVMSQLLAKAESDNKLSAVEYGLQVLRVAVLLRAEGGSFDIPFRSFGVAPEHASDELTTMKFSDMQVLFENSTNTQGVLVRMASVTAENLDHERLPAFISLTPIALGPSHPGLYDKASSYAFHLYFLHKSNLAKKEEAAKAAGAHAQPPTKPLPAKPPAKALPAPPAVGGATAPVAASSSSSALAAAPAVAAPSSEIGLKLGGLRVVVRRKHKKADATESEKPSAASTAASDLNALLPTLKETATNLMSKFAGHTTDVQKGVDIAKQSYDYLDIHWNVEFGDTEFTLLEPEETPRGTFRIGSSQRDTITKAFATLEDELVACKMALAQANEDREALTNRANEAVEQMKLAKAQAAASLEAAKKDQGVLEGILINTKLKLAEAESELMSAKAGARGPAAVPGAGRGAKK